MPQDHIPENQKSSRLKRELSLWQVVFYGLGVIIGAGIYVLIGKAAGITGNSVWLSFAIAALIASLTGLSYAELSSMFPRSSAEYIYTRKAFSSKLLSFSLSWFIIFIGAVGAATVALGFGGYFQSIFGTPVALNAIALIFALSLLNFYGLKESLKLNTICVAATIGGLLLIIFLGLPYLGSVDYFSFQLGFGGVVSAAALIFFAYLGFEDIVNVSEETKRPRKTIPRAILISIIISTTFYIIVSLSVVSIVPWQELARSNAPLADVSEAVMPGSSFLFSIIALIATASTVLIFLIAFSRRIFGMAEEHSLPKIFTSIHPSRKTPWVAIFSMMSIAMMFVLIDDVKTVASITDFGAFLIFAFVNFSLIWLRYREPSAERGFRVPVNVGVFPVLPLFGLLFSGIMLFQFEWWVMLLSISIMALGAIVYKFLDEISSAAISGARFLKKIIDVGGELLYGRQKEAGEQNKLDGKIYDEIKGENNRNRK